MSKGNQRSIGQRLLHERERLNWSQEELAEKIGTTALSINRWEHDKAAPRPFYRAELCRVFNMSSEALFDVDEGVQEEAPDIPEIWNVPHLRNLYFTGREEVLLSLHDALSARKQWHSRSRMP
jgi:transcriptional regulator with XRE-family HTH domain